MEQGIWKEKWADGFRTGRWKYEEPLELESESEDDSAAEGEPSYSLFGPPRERAEAKPRRAKRAEELQGSAERRLVREREREREASRPFHQFVYQVSKERERIQDEMNSPTMRSFDPFRTIYGKIDYYLHNWAPERRFQEEPNEGRATDETPPDINTAAYARVKDTWTKRGIWNREWGLLPGMSWKHEQSLEEMLREDDVVPAWTIPPDGNRYEREQAPPRSISRADLPAEPYNQLFSIRIAPQQEEPPTDSISGVLESHGYGTGAAPLGPVTGTYPNSSPQDLIEAPSPRELLKSDISHASTASNLWYSARMNPRQRVLSQREQYEYYSAITKAREARLATLSQGQRSGDGQTVQIAHTTTGPAHPTKVSKFHRKSGRGPQRQQNASEARSETRQSSPGLGVPALSTIATPEPLRRSRRLQEVAHNGESQSRPGQTSAGPRPSR